MSRNYPRFLFYHPRHTKSPGPFVYHTLYPRLLLRVEKDPTSKFPEVEVLDNIDKAPASELNKVVSDVQQWLVTNHLLT